MTGNTPRNTPSARSAGKRVGNTPESPALTWGNTSRNTSEHPLAGQSGTGGGSYKGTPLSAGPSEAVWQATVIDLLSLFGYRSMHVRRSIGKADRWMTSTSIAGWPDLLAWRPGRVIAIECKSQRGRLTPEQQRVLAELEAAGVQTRVARPADFDDLRRWLA